MGDICSAPCFTTAPDFAIPLSGCARNQLLFAREGDRDFYAVLLNNHPPQHRGELNPKVAIVGLSPGATQIDEFVRAYAEAENYGVASVRGAFADLSASIIAMLRGLGLSNRLNLVFPHDTLARHPDIYVTSLIACASLTSSGSSDAFDPTKFSMAQRCIGERFVDEMLNPHFGRLHVVIILGTNGWRAVQRIRCRSGETVLQSLRAAGKMVLQLPHPSGQNEEYVRLASLDAHVFPAVDEYMTRRWEDYRVKPPRKGRAKQTESRYKMKRAKIWRTVARLRQEIAVMAHVTTQRSNGDQGGSV